MMGQGDMWSPKTGYADAKTVSTGSNKDTNSSAKKWSLIKKLIHMRGATGATYIYISIEN